jgi:hypothetical protein
MLMTQANGSTLRSALLGAVGASVLAIVGSASAVAGNVPDWQKGNVVSNIGTELDKLAPRTLTGGAGMNYMEAHLHPTSTPAPLPAHVPYTKKA